MMDMWLFSESKLRTKFDTIRIREIVMTEKIFMDLLEY